MAAEVVGTAFVRIRALTTGLAKDIERGIDRGARDADVDSSGAIVGDKFAKSAGEKIKAGMEDAVRDTTKNIDKKVDVDGGRRTGDRLGESIKSGLNRSFDGFKDRFAKLFGVDEASGQKAGARYGRGLRGSLLKIAAVIAPAIFGAGSLILQYVTALVAQIGLLAQATAGAGLAMGGAFAVGLAALLPLVLAFKTQTPQLKKFTDQAKKVGKAWGEVGAATQETLLPGLEKALDYSKALIPIFRGWGREVGRVVGSHVEFLAAILASEEGQRRMRSILQQSTPVLETMARVALRLGDVLSRLFEAVLPITLQFVEAIDQMVARWQEALAVTSADGTLAATLQDWYDKASLVGGALADLWGAIWNILKVGGTSAVPFFENFSTWAARFNEWTASAVGQNRLKQIFDDALAVAHEFNGLVVDISRAIGGAVFEAGGNEGIIGFITTLREDVVPFLDTFIRETREAYGPALVEFFGVFGEFLSVLAQGEAINITLMTLTATLQAFTAALETLMSIPGFDRFLGIMLGLGAAFAILKSVGAVKLIGLLGQALVGLAGAIGVALGASGLAAFAVGGAVIAAVVAGIVLLVTHWDKVKAAFEATVRFLKDPMERLERLGELIGDLAGWIGEKLGEAWDAVTEFVGNLGSSIGDAVSDAFGSSLEAVKRWPGNIAKALGRLGSTVFGAIGKGLARLPGLLGDLLSKAGTFAFEALRASIHRGLQLVLAIFIGIPSLVGKALFMLGKFLIEAFVDGISFLVRELPRLIGSVITFFTELPGNIIKALSALGSTIADFFSGTAWPAITEAVSTGVDAVIDFFVKLPGRALDALSTIGETLAGLFQDAVDGAVDIVSTAIDNILQFFRDLPGNIASFATDIANAALDIGEDIIGGIIGGITGAAEAIGGAAADILDGIGNLIGEFKKGLFGAIDRLLPDKIDGVKVDVPGLGKITLVPSINLPDNPLKDLGLYAMGGIFTRATPGIIGEDGAEVLIPLTRPRRALELYEKSGLASVLAQARRNNSRSGASTLSPSSSGGDTIINQTFNEKVDPKHIATELAWILS